MKNNDHYKNIGVVLLVCLSIAFLYQVKYMFWGAVCLGILLFTFEKLAISFSKYWMKFGKFLGDINARIILTIFFVLILIPVSFLKRIFSAKEGEKSSTWEVEDVEVDFTKPW